MNDRVGYVENDIALEERLLAAVAELLNGKFELSRWPEDVREVFLLALWKKNAPRGMWKLGKPFEPRDTSISTESVFPPSRPTPLRFNVAARSGFEPIFPVL